MSDLRENIGRIIFINCFPETNLIREAEKFEAKTYAITDEILHEIGSCGECYSANVCSIRINRILNGAKTVVHTEEGFFCDFKREGK